MIELSHVKVSSPGSIEASHVMSLTERTSVLTWHRAEEPSLLKWVNEHVKREKGSKTVSELSMKCSRMETLYFKSHNKNEPNAKTTATITILYCQVQLTDFENAAYCCFVVLLTRVIISFRLTYLLPITLVNENMKRAQKRDAVLNQKLHFRMVSSGLKWDR